MARLGVPVPRVAFAEEDRGQYEEAAELLAPWTACAMFRAEALSRAGYFDPDHFLFYEDRGMGWRLWLLGYRVIYTPSAVAWHKSRLGQPKVTPTTT